VAFSSWKRGFHGERFLLRPGLDFYKGRRVGRSIGFNDSSWRVVDHPHDWAVELEFVNDAAWPIGSHGFKPLGRQYPETSVGWYRKSFTIAEVEKGKRFAFHLDGVFRDCMVWLNGHFIGKNMSGYTEFQYDITDYINYGSRNVMVIRVDASFNVGWFYEGAGIYKKD
jgi:beta-galactosidase